MDKKKIKVVSQERRYIETMVNGYRAAKGISYPEAWQALYRRFDAVTRCNTWGMPNDYRLDLIEQQGLLPGLLKVASEMLEGR